jgi:DNA-binding PadR family transcriptional regulator
MFDFDPRDRDEDLRDVEMPWVELRHESGLDRELDNVRDRDDARDRDPRERDVDPRDVFIDGLELPRGLEREIVIDGDHRYELNGDDSRSLATVGAFRVVSERDLCDPRDDSTDTREPDLRHLRDEGLMRFVALDGRERVVTLTERGHHLLEAHRRDREDAREQTFYAGVNRPRELSHDVEHELAEMKQNLRAVPQKCHKLVESTAEQGSKRTATARRINPLGA